MRTAAARHGCSRRRATRVAAALFLLLGLPAAALAQVIRDPVQLRIEGYIDATAAQVNPWMMIDVWLERAPGRRFALTNIIVLSAGPVSGPDVVAAIQPLHPNLILNGDASLLEKISTAQPNQYLRITGYTAFGPQRVLVTNVERGEPIVGPTPTKSMAEKVFGG
ncbi:MAG: hypothetical protein FJ148_05585 [Deltaproteobacteria bacterium]|nr:hypothetical protein [Deltaproteobacteria bacterium]